MRVLVARALGIVTIALAAASCASAGEDAIVAPGSASEDVVDGEIVVSGDLTAGAPAETDATARSTTTSTTSTTVAATTTTVRSTTAPSTAAPATTAAPTTTEADPVGDGSVMSSTGSTGSGADGTAEAPGVNDLRPLFFALDATVIVGCDIADPGAVQIRWEVIGTETVDVGVGSTSNPVQSGLPPAGSVELPLDCSTGSEYYVTASNPEGQTTESVTVSAS